MHIRYGYLIHTARVYLAEDLETGERFRVPTEDVDNMEVNAKISFQVEDDPPLDTQGRPWVLCVHSRL